MQGNNQVSASRYTGEYSPLPDHYQAAFRFGIRFIELRFPRPSDNNQPIFGPLDVRVDEDLIEGSMKVRYNVRVLGGVQAKIRYETMNKMGLCLAFMFDDKNWMNRIFLMDNQWMYDGIWAMHTREGLVPGSIIKMEIECMRDVLTEDKKIWKVMQPNGREFGFYWYEREADAELTPLRREKGWYKEEARKRDKRPDVLGIIKRNRMLAEGWTSAPEFHEKYIPKIKRLIEERQSTIIPEGDVRTTSGDIQAIVKETLLSMDPSVLEKIAAQARARQAATSATALDASQAEGSRSEPDFLFTESGLNSKTVEELRSIASQLGISRPEKIRKNDLVMKIMEAQGTPSTHEEMSDDVTEAIPGGEVVAQ